MDPHRAFEGGDLIYILKQVPKNSTITKKTKQLSPTLALVAFSAFRFEIIKANKNDLGTCCA